MAESPRYSTGPRYQDEVPAPLPESLPESAPAPTETNFPLSIVFVPVFGALAICIVAIVIVGVLTAISWEPSSSEGGALALIAVFALTFLMAGPAAFAALFVWKMRRHGRNKPRVLGIVTAVGLLPALLIGSLGIAWFTQNRGLRTTGIVTVLVFVVLALGWVLTAMGRQSLRTALLGSAVGVMVLVFTITAANLNADAHDRALERQAISGESAPLALFDSRGAVSERDGWRIVEVETIHVDRSHQYGRLALRLENPSEQIVSVDFRSNEEGSHCSATAACQPLLTLDNGTVIHGEPGAVGTRFDFPAPRNQGWWTLYTNASLTATDLTEVVALLHPVTVDAWIAAQPRFDNEIALRD